MRAGAPVGRVRSLETNRPRVPWNGGGKWPKREVAKCVASADVQRIARTYACTHAYTRTVLYGAMVVVDARNQWLVRTLTEME